MSLGMMKRFSSEYISRLQQIGLAFFEKIATDLTLAGETQDFYQGVLVGLERAVKLIDEENGVQKLSVLEAKIATFIDEESILNPKIVNSSFPQNHSNVGISRLSKNYIEQLKKGVKTTHFDLEIEECVCPTETQDFYHGCIAAFDFALLLAGEKYAYAQMSLLKTNIANFIELNPESQHQIDNSNFNSLPTLNPKSLSQNRRLIDSWVQTKSENFADDLTEEEEVKWEPGDKPVIPKEFLDANFNESEFEVKDNLNNDIDRFKKRVAGENKPKEEEIREQVEKGEEQRRWEMERLLVSLLQDDYQQQKLGQLKIVEDWTAFLEEGEAIRVISHQDGHLVLRVTLEGDVHSALSYCDAEKLTKAAQETTQGLAASLSKLESTLSQVPEPDLSMNLMSSPATLDIEQIKLAESILPGVKKAFESLLNYASEPAEEIEEDTRIQFGDLYDLRVKASGEIVVFSLTAYGRGEIIKVQGNDLVLAQGILSEDVEFWAAVAARLEPITDAGPSLSPAIQNSPPSVNHYLT